MKGWPVAASEQPLDGPENAGDKSECQLDGSGWSVVNDDATFLAVEGSFRAVEMAVRDVEMAV